MGTENKVILELLKSHSDLTSDNPILELGQKVIVTGLGGPDGYYPYKIGDAVTAYNDLPFGTQTLYMEAAEFTSENPILRIGQLGYETDTGYVKFGDGSTEWTSLGYQPNPAEVDGKASLSTYSTAWINRSDWTNVHLGTDDTKDVDSNLNHALSAPLSDLIVKVFISTDGTDANSFVVLDSNVDAGGGSTNTGITVFAVDNNNVKIQTGSSGIGYVLDAGGSFTTVNTEDWYYKIKVYKLS